MQRPNSLARAYSSVPCSHRSALLAVTTSFPDSSNASMISRAGLVPPISCTATSISSSSMISWMLSVSIPSGNSTSRGLLRSRTTTRRSSMARPARRVMRSGCSSNTWATPLPTVPKPIMPIFSGFICFNSSRFIPRVIAIISASGRRFCA